MIESFWNTYLYRPVFNALIFFYNNFSAGSLGIAVILLTIFVRLLLLPLSILSGRTKEFYNRLIEKIKEIDRDYGSDFIKKKEMVRKLLKENRINPWSRVVVLGVQLLVLILLYQVFVSGMNPEKLSLALYPFIDFPEFIDTQFFWFDLKQRNWLISMIAGVALYFEILYQQRAKKEILTQREHLFRFFFPLVTIIVLSLLPSVKSIFVLTSIIFSFILQITTNFISQKISKRKNAKASPENKIDLREITIKRIE